MILTKKKLANLLTKGIGINRAQAKELGIDYPPISGWRKGLVGSDISEDRYKKVMGMKGKKPTGDYGRTQLEMRELRKIARLNPSLPCVDILASCLKVNGKPVYETYYSMTDEKAWKFIYVTIRDSAGTADMAIRHMERELDIDV